MRLTCPRCGARYEIPDQAIPATGREVECSACSEVWFQPGPEAPAQAAEPAGDTTVPAGYDATARPALHQPLHESILSILREETARELSARRGPDRAPQADHIPASAPEAAPGTDASGTVEPPAPRKADWPVSTVILPGEPLSPDDDKGADAAPVDPTPDPAPARPAEAPRLPDAERLAATLLRRTPVRTIDAETEDEIAPDPAGEPVVTATMLARPAPEDAPALPDPVPASARPATGSALIVPSAPLPAPSRGGARAGYGMGFGLAVMLALAVLAFYTLAPRVSTPGETSVIAEWRAGIDRGRVWLSDRAGALWTGLTGE